MTKRLDKEDRLTGIENRGNRTHGAARKGFKGGSKPLYPPGTELAHVAFKLSEQEYAIALWFGKGIASRGLRYALEVASRTEPLPPGVSKLDRYAMLEQTKAQARADAWRARLARLGESPQTLTEALKAADWDDVTPGDDNDDEA